MNLGHDTLIFTSLSHAMVASKGIGVLRSIVSARQRELKYSLANW